MWGLSWKERALDLLLPRACVACGEDLPSPLTGPACGACLAHLRPLSGPRCARCAGRCSGHAKLCPACASAGPSLRLVRAAFPYRSPLPELLYAFKYHGSPCAGRLLAGWLAGALHAFPELGAADAVVPVPLHPTRRRERGFNQARVLAEAVARAARRPVIDALVRTHRTAAQWRFDRARRRSRLEGAFAAARGRPVRGLCILLVDDVCTSGGTLEACARALRRARAASVLALVLARG